MEIIVGPNSTVNHFTPGNFAAYKVGATLDTSLWLHYGAYPNCVLGEVISEVKEKVRVYAHLGHGAYDFAVLDTDTNYLVWATVELPGCIFAQTSEKASDRLLTPGDPAKVFRSLLTPQDEKLLRAMKIGFEGDAPAAPAKSPEPVYQIQPTLSLDQLDSLDYCRPTLNALSALVLGREIAVYAPKTQAGHADWRVEILGTPFYSEGMTLHSAVSYLTFVVERLSAENRAFHFRRPVN